MLVSVLLSSACANSGNMENDFYKKKMIENMRLASVWLIEEGIKVFSSKGKEGLHRKLVDEWGVQLWIDPWVETKDYLAQFRIKARGINYQIINLHREKVGDDLYEFWIVKIVTKPWSGESNRSVFFITKASEVYGQREIIKESDQFIEGYEVNGQVITFPTKDLKLLYEMEAWAFPENYKDSDLKDIKVIVDGDGNFKKEKIQ